MVPENWHHCHPYIHHQGKSDPPNHRDEHAVVDIEQKNGKAGEEQEQVDVDQGRQYFNCPPKMHLVHAISKICAHSSSLLWAASCSLSEPGVSICPLTQHHCQESTCKADH